MNITETTNYGLKMENALLAYHGKPNMHHYLQTMTFVTNIHDQW